MSHRRSLIEKLREVHAFPCVYTIKIIGDVHSLREEGIDAAVRGILPGALFKLEHRTSSGGRFIAWSLSIHVQSAETVADLYETLQHLPGLRSLF